jgi:hypothetical protein
MSSDTVLRNQSKRHKLGATDRLYVPAGHRLVALLARSVPFWHGRQNIWIAVRFRARVNERTTFESVPGRGPRSGLGSKLEQREVVGVLFLSKILPEPTRFK